MMEFKILLLFLMVSLLIYIIRERRSSCQKYRVNAVTCGSSKSEFVYRICRYCQTSIYSEKVNDDFCRITLIFFLSIFQITALVIGLPVSRDGESD